MFACWRLLKGHLRNPQAARATSKHIRRGKADGYPFEGCVRTRNAGDICVDSYSFRRENFNRPRGEIVYTIKRSCADSFVTHNGFRLPPTAFCKS